MICEEMDLESENGKQTEETSGRYALIEEQIITDEQPQMH